MIRIPLIIYRESDGSVSVRKVDELKKTPLLVCAEMVGRVMEQTRMQKRKRLEIELRRKTPLVPGELTPK